MDPNQHNSRFDPSRAWAQRTETEPSSFSTDGNSQYVYPQYSQQYQQLQHQQLVPQQQQRQQRQKSNTSPETPPQSAKRSRISRACDTCRKKKIRCDVDNCHPCTTCKQYDWECTFNDTARKRGPPKGYIEGLEARLKRMEQLLGSIQSDETKDNSASTSHHSSSNYVSASPTYSTSSPAHSGHNSPQSLHETMDGSELSNDSYQAPKGKVVRYLGSSSGLYLVNDILKNKEHDNNKEGDGTSVSSPSSPSANSGSGIGPSVDATSTTATDTSASHPPLSQYSSKDQLTSVTAPSKSKDDDDDGNYTSLQTRQGTYKLRRMNVYDDDLMMVRDETEDESRILAAAANEQETMDKIIPRSMLANLVNIYFEAQCMTLPILEKDEFINSFEGKTHPPPAPLLTYAICSYACFLVPSNHPIFAKSGLERNQIFHALVDRAGMFIRAEYLVPRIQTIQALILLCSHPTYSSGSYRNWLLAGMAVRMAQDLALHRSVTHTGTTPGDDILNEKRRRLWYSVYVTDRWCCSVMGRPLAIADSDCDVDLPNIDAVDQPGKYTMFVNLVKLSGILGEVLRRIYSPKAKAMGYGTHVMEQTVWSLDKMLKEWFDSVPSECLITQDELRSMKGMERTQETRFRSGGPLTVCYYAVVVLLFRPFIVFECGNHHNSKLFNDAPGRCMEAAKNAIDVARYIPEGEINRFGWNFAAYSVFQASLIHVYNCTSNDPVVAQNSRDYIRISIDECMSPITKDIPFGPPAVQFLENLLHLMKADPSFMRSTTDNGSPSEKAQFSTSGHPPSSNSSTANTNQSTTAHHPSYPPPSSRFIPTSLPTGPAPHSRSSPLPPSQQHVPSASPMSVYQIVTGMEQPTSSTASTTTVPPPSNSNSNTNRDLPPSVPTNNDYTSNPIDLITLALTQDSLLGNQDNPMMTQATWKYLFSSAGTPFTNNANSGSEFQVSWENMFMDGQGNQNFTS